MNFDLINLSSAGKRLYRLPARNRWAGTQTGVQALLAPQAEVVPHKPLKPCRMMGNIAGLEES